MSLAVFDVTHDAHVELATAGSDPGRRCFLVGVENGSSGGDDGPPAEQAAADHDGSP